MVQPPNVSALIEREAGEIAWPMRTTQAPVLNAQGDRPIAFAESPDALGLLAWAMQDSLLAKLDAMLAEEADETNALSVADRQRQGAQIARDLLVTEHDLAALVWRGIDDRLPVWFDADMSPMAIIGAQLTTNLATDH